MRTLDKANKKATLELYLRIKMPSVSSDEHNRALGMLAYGLMHREAYGLMHREAYGLIHREAYGLIHREAYGLIHREAHGLMHRHGCSHRAI